MKKIILKPVTGLETLVPVKAKNMESGKNYILPNDDKKEGAVVQVYSKHSGCPPYVWLRGADGSQERVSSLYNVLEMSVQEETADVH